MSVSIWYKTPRGRRVYLSLGAPSFFFGKLYDEGLFGSLDKTHVPLLEVVADREFDADGQYRQAVSQIVRAIEKYEYIDLDFAH